MGGILGLRVGGCCPLVWAVPIVLGTGQRLCLGTNRIAPLSNFLNHYQYCSTLAPLVQ